MTCCLCSRPANARTSGKVSELCQRCDALLRRPRLRTEPPPPERVRVVHLEPVTVVPPAFRQLKHA